MDLPDWLQWEPTWYPCPRCRTEQMRPTGICWDCEKREVRERAAHASVAATLQSIPAEFRWAQFGVPELAERVKCSGIALEDARLGASSGATKRVVLAGTAGTGKTSLACAMLREWAGAKNLRGLFLPAVRVSGGRFELDDYWLHVPLLVIDDVGTERAQANNMLPELIYERHAAGRPTWITTGLTSVELVDRYGDGIARRLTERSVILKLGARP